MTVDTLICVHSITAKNDQLLNAAITSVLTGSVKPDNLVVVYDACWQYTQHYIEDAHDFPLLIEGVNYIPVAKSVKQGLAVAKNFGLKFCTGDWVSFLDADDMYFPSKLELQKKYAENNPKTDLIFCQAWDVRQDRIPVPNCFPIGYATTHEQIKSKIFTENCLCHGTAFIKKTVLESLGGYNTDRRVLGAEDWDLWQRAFQAGFIFHNIPERLYYYSLNTGVSR